MSGFSDVKKNLLEQARFVKCTGNYVLYLLDPRNNLVRSGSMVCPSVLRSIAELTKKL